MTIMIFGGDGFMVKPKSNQAGLTAVHGHGRKLMMAGTLNYLFLLKKW
jgi:hypothetical protein